MKFLLALTVLLSITNCIAQINLDIDIHCRVNEKDKEVASVLEVYKNYLNNRPDSIQPNNPYWCIADRNKFHDFDFTRRFIYDQYPMEYLCKSYRFVILSIEKEDNNYIIRTAILAKDLTDTYTRQQNPWAITRLYAIRESNTWKLKNAFDFKTKNWKSITESNISFHFSPDINIDKNEIQKSKTFCDSISVFLHTKNWLPFDYYITNSVDKLSELLGFDFALTAATTGMAFKDNILLTGTGTVFYPHEFVHHVAEEKQIKHKLIIEGLATWLGGSQLETFEQNLVKLSNAIKNSDTLTVDKVIDLNWGWTVGADYITGGLFCRLVYEKHGLSGLDKLFSIPANDNKKLKQILMELLKTNDLNEVWKNELLKH